MPNPPTCSKECASDGRSPAVDYESADEKYAIEICVYY